jgi:hypothetical protein
MAQTETVDLLARAAQANGTNPLPPRPSDSDSTALANGARPPPTTGAYFASSGRHPAPLIGRLGSAGPIEPFLALEPDVPGDEVELTCATSLENLSRIDFRLGYC